jgi:hypothetical protein
VRYFSVCGFRTSPKSKNRLRCQRTCYYTVLEPAREPLVAMASPRLTAEFLKGIVRPPPTGFVPPNVAHPFQTSFYTYLTKKFIPRHWYLAAGATFTLTLYGTLDTLLQSGKKSAYDTNVKEGKPTCEWGMRSQQQGELAVLIVAWQTHSRIAGSLCTGASHVVPWVPLVPKGPDGAHTSTQSMPCTAHHRACPPCYSQSPLVAATKLRTDTAPWERGGHRLASMPRGRTWAEHGAAHGIAHCARGATATRAGWPPWAGGDLDLAAERRTLRVATAGEECISRAPCAWVAHGPAAG